MGSDDDDDFALGIVHLPRPSLIRLGYGHTNQQEYAIKTIVFSTRACRRCTRLVFHPLLLLLHWLVMQIIVYIPGWRVSLSNHPSPFKSKHYLERPRGNGLCRIYYKSETCLTRPLLLLFVRAILPNECTSPNNHQPSSLSWEQFR